MKKKVPWNGVVSMCSRAGSWQNLVDLHNAKCAKWKMNILVKFCINFTTRQAGRHSVFQAWTVWKICHQSQRTRACRTSCHKLAHCEGLATFGNRKLCCIHHCMCPCTDNYASNTVVKRDHENCCPHGLLFISKALKSGRGRSWITGLAGISGLGPNSEPRGNNRPFPETRERLCSGKEDRVMWLNLRPG